MRLQRCTTTSVAALILFLIVPTQGRKYHHNKAYKESHHLESRIQDSEDSPPFERIHDVHNYLTSHEEQEECHRAALHKCGQTFLRAHKLLSYLDDENVAFRTRCGVRTAFFECLKTTTAKICSRQYKHTYKMEPEFRKKLTDAIWATRVCILGVKSLKRI